MLFRPSAWMRRWASTFLHRRSTVSAAIRIGFKPSAINFLRLEAVERDQAPCDIVGALVRNEVADEMTAASWNDLPPIRRILLEGITLERIDLVADEACN